MDKIDKFIFIARMAEQVRRYRDMATAMAKVVSCGGGLNEEQREMVSVAYQNLTSVLRSSIRKLTEDEEDRPRQYLREQYKKQIEDELLQICVEVLKLINRKIIPHLPKLEEDGDHLEGGDDSCVAVVFYYKMMADHLRYIAEICTDEDRKAASDKALFFYETAGRKGKIHLHPRDPIRLGTALNFSVFFYEILGRVEDAKRVIREAFDDADVRVQNLPCDNDSKTAKVLHMLRNNLILWEGEVV